VLVRNNIFEYIWASGQNGFKLSVFGFDSEADYQALANAGLSAARKLRVERQVELIVHDRGWAVGGSADAPVERIIFSDWKPKPFVPGRVYDRPCT